MRKNKIILSVLIIGLLLCGIGGGIMFTEFTGLDYAGEYVLKTGTPETKTIELSLEDYPEGPLYASVSYYSLMPLEDRLVVDETVEEGKILIKTTFDPERVTPFAGIDIQPIENEKPESYLWINYSSHDDDLAFFFQMKDMILRDLKNNTLRSYRTEDVLDLTITVGPETAKRLVF